VSWTTRLRIAWRRLLYEGSGRDRWQQPERVVAVLGLHAGDSVADLGSGTGYFTLRFARAVGPDGRVYAVDTDEDLLTAIADEAKSAGLANVTTVEASDSRLELASPVDVIFLSNVFHHLPDQAPYFAAARDQLAPGGRVAIVESIPRGIFRRLFGHATDPALIESTMASVGYRRVASHDFVDRHSFQVFAAA
jgi:ubiquinone/menaquinone biosynthesis C-methylase UbiE